MKLKGVAQQALSWTVLLLVGFVGFSLVHHFVRFTVVHGTSMYPTYKDGDLLLSMPAEQYKVGDVVTYHPSDLPCTLCNVVHRVIRGNASGWITQGDNNPNLDGWKPSSSEISGKVVLHVAMLPLAKIAYQPSMWLMLLFGCLSLYFYRQWLKKKDAEGEPSGPRHRAEAASSDSSSSRARRPALRSWRG